MSSEVQLLEQIIILVKQLPQEYRLRLIELIAKNLIESQSEIQRSRPLQYGKFRGDNMSTPEDFTLAEWQPNDRELNGA